MAKKQVIECQCERCPAKWYEDPKDPKENAQARVEFKLGDDNVSKVFGVLCERCSNAVRNYIASILREPKKDSEDNAEGVEKEEEVTAVSPSPSRPPKHYASP